ncbi:hypothetical protein [Fructobacillus fructosus]|uniref:Uncharacterized protein n=1 Tax=Fructobacillus fructosus TaxID=1631 RepID=A0ABM9MQP0_9LACO|nr:hypothetical protein R54839_PPFHFPJH_00543 [Fructobacillus fructosus]CAK1252244.1 hypothetical protein R54866_LGPIEIPA_01469 [Fructobacillus fructosus]
MTLDTITPCIKIQKVNGMMGMDMYIEYQDNITVTEMSGEVTTGILFDLELGTDEEMDDVLVVKTKSGDLKKIGTSWILDIDSI